MTIINLNDYRANREALELEQKWRGFCDHVDERRREKKFKDAVEKQCKDSLNKVCGNTLEKLSGFAITDRDFQADKHYNWYDMEEMRIKTHNRHVHAMKHAIAMLTPEIEKQPHEAREFTSSVVMALLNVIEGCE